MSVDPSLGITLEPMDEPPRLPANNWLQDDPLVYAQPLWVEKAAEVPARLSPETTGVFALLAGYPGDSWYLRQGIGDHLLAQSGWSSETTFHIALAESQQPIEEGFLRRLRFWRSSSAPAHGCSVADVLRRFVTAETERVGDAEAWLRSKLGPKRPKGPLYDRLDYPGFDCGTGALGFATLLHGPELHVWSRFVHHHK